jgi:hypothetical protein
MDRSTSLLQNAFINIRLEMRSMSDCLDHHHHFVFVEGLVSSASSSRYAEPGGAFSCLKGRRLHMGHALRRRMGNRATRELDPESHILDLSHRHELSKLIW